MTTQSDEDAVDSAKPVDDWLLLRIFLSALVASVGLVEDNLIVVLAGLLISPLPTTVHALVPGYSSMASGGGLRPWLPVLLVLGLSFVLAALVGYLWPVDMATGQMLIGSTELLALSNVRLDNVVVALAAGGLMVLGPRIALPQTVIGLLISIALLPPVLGAGLLAGAGLTTLALGAGLLFSINVACLALTARLLLTAHESNGDTQATGQGRPGLRAGIGWGVLVVCLAGLILAHRYAAFH
jgi:uncharacterized membrane protein